MRAKKRNELLYHFLLITYFDLFCLLERNRNEKVISLTYVVFIRYSNFSLFIYGSRMSWMELNSFLSFSIPEKKRNCQIHFLVLTFIFHPYFCPSKHALSGQYCCSSKNMQMKSHIVENLSLQTQNGFFSLFDIFRDISTF